MYEYQLMNNHYIVTIGENKFLIDTGAPSFRINDEVREVVIDGHSHSLRPKLPQMDDEAVRKTFELVGTEVDGFLGLDLIAQTSLTIYKDGRLDFKTHDVKDAQVVPLLPTMGLAIEITSSGIRGAMVLDTGAKYGYLDERLIRGLEPCARDVYDFNPIKREMKSDMYNIDFSIGGVNKTIVAGYNEETLGFPIGNGNIMIGNITTLFNEVCVIDARRNCLLIK